MLLNDAICDEGDSCENLINYYDAQEVHFQNVQLAADADRVPRISDIRDILLDEMNAQLKSYFPNSDLKFFKIFIPKNMPTQVGEALTYGVMEINNLCAVFKMSNCLKLVVDWANLLDSIIESPDYCTYKTSNVESYAFWSGFLNIAGIRWTDQTTELIQRILVSPIGSAEAERGFSIFNHIKSSRRSSMIRKHVENLMRIRINGPDDLEKFSAHKYAKEFILNHIRTDDTRYQHTKAISLIDHESKTKKFLPKLSFL